jgi:hypothetical protein
MLQHEVLHVDDAFAAMERRRRQYVEQVGILDQEIRMLTEVMCDVRCGQGARRRWRAGLVGGGFVLGAIQRNAPMLFRCRAKPVVNEQLLTGHAMRECLAQHDPVDETGDGAIAELGKVGRIDEKLHAPMLCMRFGPAAQRLAGMAMPEALRV